MANAPTPKKRVSAKTILYFVIGGLIMVGLRFLPDLLYPDYSKQYYGLCLKDRFELANEKIKGHDKVEEKIAALTQMSILANDEGFAPAQFFMGEMFRTGTRWLNAPNGDCQKNFAEARIWYKAAARQKYKPAIDALEHLQVDEATEQHKSNKIKAPRHNDQKASITKAETIKNVDIKNYISTERFDSLFGVFFGCVFASNNPPFVSDAGGMAYSFSPTQKFLGFEEYSCIVTPKSHKVCSVFADMACETKKAAKEQLQMVVHAIEKRYSASMANIDNTKLLKQLDPVIHPFLKYIPAKEDGDIVYFLAFSNPDTKAVRALCACTSSNCIYVHGFDLDTLILKNKEMEQTAIDAL